MNKIDELIEQNEKFATNHFNEYGNLTPMFILHTENGAVPVAIPFSDDKEKQMAVNAVRLLILKYCAHSYSFMSEVWMKRCGPEGKDFEGQVKDQPDKEEGLMISYIGYDRKEMIYYSIKRDDDKVNLERMPGENQCDGGVMAELLPEQGKTLSEEERAIVDLLIEGGANVFNEDK